MAPGPQIAKRVIRLPAEAPPRTVELPRFEGALAHPTRRRIFEHLRSNPGGSRRELGEVLDIPAPTLRHHLDVLWTGRQIVAKKVGREYLYTAGAKLETLVGLRSPCRKRIITLLLEAPRTQRELSDITGLSQRLVAYHLSILTDILSVSPERPRRYSVREPERIRSFL